MTLPLFDGTFGRRRYAAPPGRSPLTVKTARIAHNRHRPELKKDISADIPVRDELIYKKTYLQVFDVRYLVIRTIAVAAAVA
jgi:hypothetical protein